MKAILKVNKNSSYAKYNYLTFDVKEVLSNLIALNINGVTVDFQPSEVIIVDFPKEYQDAKDDNNAGYSAKLEFMIKYIDVNNIPLITNQINL